MSSQFLTEQNKMKQQEHRRRDEDDVVKYMVSLGNNAWKSLTI